MGERGYKTDSMKNSEHAFVAKLRCGNLSTQFSYFGRKLSYQPHMSNFHNWSKGHNREGMSQTIQLPYASQYPYLEQGRNILSEERTDHRCIHYSIHLSENQDLMCALQVLI